MRVAVPKIPDFERVLLRKSVNRLTAGRHRCSDCRRTPLLGERVFVFEGGKTVCELCRMLRRGEPLRSERVLGPEHGHAVRLRVLRAPFDATA